MVSSRLNRCWVQLRHDQVDQNSMDYMPCYDLTNQITQLINLLISFNISTSLRTEHLEHEPSGSIAEASNSTNLGYTII